MSTLNTTTSSNPPANPTTGDVYLETDTNKIVLWDGSVWRKYNPDSPVVNNNTGAGSSNEIGSAYIEGTMTLTLSTEWPAYSESDISNFPYFTLPDYMGNTGGQTYISGYDYSSNSFGWIDGMGGGQTYDFGGRIYALGSKDGSEPDFEQYLTDFDSLMGTSDSGYYGDLETYVAGLGITFMSMCVIDSNNYTGFGTHSLYDNNTMVNYYGFTALTWTHGSTEVDVRIFTWDMNNSVWVDYKLYTFGVGTVPAYDSTNPVSLQPTVMVTKNAGGYSDQTTTFSSGAPTFSLTPAVFTT